MEAAKPAADSGNCRGEGGGGGGGSSTTSPFSGERSKFKQLLMERTPAIGVLKTKFLTVIGNSNELLNGISNKLTISLSSSDSDYCDDDDEDLPKFDETIDYTKIDFEARRVKARRAHEEIMSGRYRYPNLAPRPRLECARMSKGNKPKPGAPASQRSTSSSSTSSSSDSSAGSSASLPEPAKTKPKSKPADEATAAASHVSSTTRSESIESRHSGGYVRARAIAGARRSELDLQRDMQRVAVNTVEPPPPTTITTTVAVSPPPADAHRLSVFGATLPALPLRLPTPHSRASNSSTLTSLRDELDQQVSPSVESLSEWRHFIRSESQNSVPSWASSISLDCRTGEEPVKEFMKHFVETLFGGTLIEAELKSEFGALVRAEHGRQWYARLLHEQRNKCKCVPALSFRPLIQHTCHVLYECVEAEHYTPAAIILQLCFAFYREIEVPGCDPYHEYLCLFMRRQPIWHVLGFWLAAFNEALQSEQQQRTKARLRRAARHAQRRKSKEEPPETGTGAEPSKPCTSTQTKEPVKTPDVELAQDELAFRQLSVFTCNMHALGATQDLSMEFLKKQVVALNLSKDKIKLLKDNLLRMYHETDSWGAKET